MHMTRWKEGRWKGGEGQKEVKEEVDSVVGYFEVLFLRNNEVFQKEEASSSPHLVSQRHILQQVQHLVC